MSGDHESGSTSESPRDLTPSLVARLRQGDSRAGALLETLYRQPLLRFCWWHLRSLEDADDAVQDIFCKVQQSQKIPDNFRAWIYKIARNHCINIRRAHARRREVNGLASDFQIMTGGTGLFSQLARSEHIARTMARIDALPAAQREVLILLYWQDLSRKETAEVLRLPESVVKSRRCEAMKILREQTTSTTA